MTKPATPQIDALPGCSPLGLPLGPSAPAKHTLSPVAQQAAKLRAELKAAGITASVRSTCFSLGQTLHVEVRAGSWAKACQIAAPYEKVRRDSATGEVLCGGNTHLNLEAWPKCGAAAVLPACMAACSALANCGQHTTVPIDGTDCSLACGDWANTCTVVDRRARWMNQHHVGKADPIEVAKVVATIIFKRG